MHTVIKLAGVNGSGKTTLARAVAKRLGVNFETEWIRAPSNAVYYSTVLKDKQLTKAGFKRFLLLGNYATTCGGMDTINNQPAKSALVRAHAVAGNLLLFEGILTGVTYGEFGEFSETLGQKGKWVYAFMGTSFEECVKRVMGRRAARGNTKPFDFEKTMRSKLRAFESVRARAVAAGHAVYVVGNGTPEQEAKNLINFAGAYANRKAV